MYYVLDLRNLQEQVKKAFCFKNVLTFPCSNKLLQIFDFQPQISKVFLDHLNNFGNKMPFLYRFLKAL